MRLFLSHARRIKGNFDHGHLTGFAEVFYVNGDLLRANFGRGSTLHGTAAKFDLRGRLLQLARYESGVRTGHSWQMVTDFGVAVYGKASPGDKGRVSSQVEGEVLLCYFSNTSDIFAVTGTFEDSILQGQGRPRWISRAWFSDGGIMMHLEASDDVMEDFEEGRYRFRAGSNLANTEERLKAQAAWLWNQRYSQLEPNGMIRHPHLVEEQFREKRNITEAMADHKDETCAKLMRTEEVTPGMHMMQNCYL